MLSGVDRFRRIHLHDTLDRRKSNALERRGSSSSRRSIKREKKKSKNTIVIKESGQRVFIYFELSKFDNEYLDKEDFFVQLRHGDQIFGLTTQVSRDRTSLGLLQELRKYYMIFDQGDVKLLNEFCDAPIQINIFKRQIKVNVDDDENELIEELLIPVGTGQMDILELFSSKVVSKNVITYIYPFDYSDKSPMPFAVKFEWKIKTVLPLRNAASFCNIAYIAFESIYNLPEDFYENHEDLTVALYFQSKIPNEFNKYDKYFICTFGNFKNEIIQEQSIYQAWESLKNQFAESPHHMAIRSDLQVKNFNRFNNLCKEEKTNFQFDQINEHTDRAFVCNSIHRYAMNDELSFTIEQSLAFNQYNLLVEAYKASEPDVIIMNGTVELQILLYPQVNSCRFAVPLQFNVNQGSNVFLTTIPNKKKSSTSVSRKQSTISANQSKRNLSTATHRSSVDYQRLIMNKQQKPIFAIVNICLLVPITDVHTPISTIEEKNLLVQCLCYETEPDIEASVYDCEELFLSFDTIITNLIKYMIKNDVKKLDDAKGFFCCNLQNLENKITQLIACHYNRITKTKTNLEFSRLMTTIYADLETRLYNLVQIVSERYEKGFISDEKIIIDIIDYTTTVKILNEAGNLALAKFYIDDLNKNHSDSNALRFFLMLYDVEKMEFEKAKEYFQLPLSKKYAFVLGDFILIYINYMDHLASEETSNASFELLINDLIKFNSANPKQYYGWILLHCLYKKSNYLPGMEFTRWRYEYLYGTKKWTSMFKLPKSLWQIYNASPLTHQNVRDKTFNEVFKAFCMLGCYKFAEMIFMEISGKYDYIECEIVYKTLELLLSQKTFKNEEQQKKSALKRKSARLSTNRTGRKVRKEGVVMIADSAQTNLGAFREQVIGNLSYANGYIDDAYVHYRNVINMKNLNVEDFLLSFLRSGYQSYEMGDYETAAFIFDKCLYPSDISMVISYELGRSLYMINRLDEALLQFSNCTRYHKYFPDAWGYLALINLKNGRNFNALECWKYARLKEDEGLYVSDFIIQELNKIDHRDILLFVDVPKDIDTDMDDETFNWDQFGGCESELQ